MKLTIASTDPTFSLSLSDPINHCWPVIGFIGSEDTPPALTQTGNAVLRLDYPSHLLLDIGLPGADVVTTNWQHSNYVIPMDSISQYVIVHNRAATFNQLQCYNLGAGISSLVVRLMRPDGSIANLNGAEFAFVLGVESPN